MNIIVTVNLDDIMPELTNNDFIHAIRERIIEAASDRIVDEFLSITLLTSRKYSERKHSMTKVQQIIEQAISEHRDAIAKSIEEKIAKSILDSFNNKGVTK